jgi:alanine racemase
MPVDHRPTQALIHIDRLVANYRNALALGAGKSVIAVVKTDAYGHGAVAVARALESVGCRFFGVASLAEAIELRDGGIRGDIVNLGGLFPGDEEEAVRAGVTCTVYDADVAERLNRAARRLNETAAVHLKVDTGMSRLGFDLQGFGAFVRSLSGFDALAVRGLYSHLAESDRVDGAVSDGQAELLRAAHRTLVGAVGEVAHVHLGNSAALLLRRPLPGDLVRPGVMLYGGNPLTPALPETPLLPVLELQSALVQVRRVERGRKVSYGGTWAAGRDSVLGIVPAGYGDGVPRLLSNRGEVIVGGKRVPIVGRVCMDFIIVDVTDVPGAQPGDGVTLLGRQGEATVSAEEWAAWSFTISYEIFCGIGKRVPRVYVGEAEVA